MPGVPVNPAGSPATTEPSKTTSSRTILGPLTTVFTPPSRCTSLFQPFVDQDEISDLVLSTVAWQAATCSSSSFFKSSTGLGVLENDLDCWPPTLQSSSIDDFSGAGIYSPGLFCPRDYITACTALKNATTSTSANNGPENFTFQYPLLPEETAAGCCPR